MTTQEVVSRTRHHKNATITGCSRNWSSIKTTTWSRHIFKAAANSRDPLIHNACYYLLVHGLNNACSTCLSSIHFCEEKMNSGLLEVCSSDMTSDRNASSTLNFSKYRKKGRKNSDEEKRKMQRKEKNVKLSEETFALAVCGKTRQ